MNILKMKYRASFTIEAAVIVPIMMVLFLAVIYVSMLLHDKVTMFAVNEYALLEQAGNTNISDDRAISGIRELLERRLLAGKNISVSFQSATGKGHLVSSAYYHIPLQMTGTMVGTGEGQISADVNATNLLGRPVLLRYKWFFDGAEKMFGDND